VSINDELLENVTLRTRKFRSMAVGVPLRSPRHTPLSKKVGTKIRRPVSVAQSIWFACVLRATEVVLFVLFQAVVARK
jgi:hypothetical protein